MDENWNPLPYPFVAIREGVGVGESDFKISIGTHIIQ